MALPTKIAVTKDNELVFKSEAGMYGTADSVCRDFACFASPLIGAAYSYLSYVEAAERIAANGYETMIIKDGSETRIAAV